MKWQNFIGHGVFVTSIVISIIVIAVFRVIHVARRRRSPLHGKQVGHVPGQQLLERIERHDTEAGIGFDLMLLALPLMFMIWATLRLDWTQLRWGVGETLFAIGWAAFFGYGLWHYQRHYRRREQVRDGLLAERVTGMQLNRLMAQDCMVMHDLPAEGFNIDHIVIAPRGIYAVETKSFRKPKNAEPNTPATVTYDGGMLDFGDFKTRKPLEQSRRHAKWLADFLRESMGEPIPVRPCVALPGWFIQKSEASRGASVFVFTPMGRGCEYFTYGDDVIAPEKRRMIAQALATRYPKIED
ncbi:nuclease-related domain-containing protein [Luteimonas sp. e5]